ncbi:MAG: DUF6632 domain-containing protein [Pelobium sp.]
MTQAEKIKKLKIFLNIYGVLSLMIFGLLFVAFIFKFESFNPGNTFHWLIWDDVQGHVGLMIVTIYLIWGIYFFVAAKSPEKNISFLKFTMWANLGHGLIMIPLALDGTHIYTSKFLTDIPFILFLSIGIYILLPEVESKNEVQPY